MWAVSFISSTFYIAQDAVAVPAASGAAPAPAAVAGADPAHVPNHDAAGGEGPPGLAGAGLNPPPAGAAAVPQAVCIAVDGAVGAVDDSFVIRDRWSVVNKFLHKFLAEPVIGAFAGLKRVKIR